MDKSKDTLLITDLHLKSNNILLVKNICEQAIYHAKQSGVTDIICAGDIFDKRENQTQEVLLAFKEILHAFADNDLFFHCIRGNHDCTDQNSQYSYLSIYEGLIENFKVCTEVDAYQKYNVCFFFMPYYPDKLYYEKILEQQNFVKEYEQSLEGCKRILITHQGIDGVTNNDGSEHESEYLKTSLFSFYDYVYVGHYHNKSELSDNIIYFGSAYQGNFGEDEDKGFIILDEYGAIKYKIQTQFPKYKHLKIEVSSYGEDDKKRIEDLLDEYDNVRITFKGNKDEIQGLNFSELKQKGVDVKTEKIANLFEDEEGIEQFDPQKINTFVQDYCNENIRGKAVKNKIKELLEL